MIFGRGGGGGIINRVTKRTGLEPAAARSRSVGDSFGGFRLTGDFDQPLGNGARPSGQRRSTRMATASAAMSTSSATASIRRSASRLGADTRIDLSYEYFHDRRTTDRGIPSELAVERASSTIRSTSRSTASTRPSSAIRTRASRSADVHLAQLRRSSTSFGDGLTLRNRTLLRRLRQVLSEHLSQRRRRRGAGHGRAGRLQRRHQAPRTCSARPTWSGKAGSAASTRPCWSGSSLADQTGRSQRRNGVFSSTSTGPTSLVDVPLSDPTVERAGRPSLANGDEQRYRDRTWRRSTCRTSFGRPDWLELVAGLRFDRFNDRRRQSRQRAADSSGPTTCGRRGSG